MFTRFFTKNYITSKVLEYTIYVSDISELRLNNFRDTTDLIIGEFNMFFNPTTLLQLVSLFLVITAGPAIIVLIALRRGNL